MKKIISVVLPIAICGLFTTRCNNSDYDNSRESSAIETSPAVSDSGTAATASEANGNTATITNPAPDTAHNSMDQMAAKKSKKGMVTVPMEEKTSGSEGTMDKEGYYSNVYPSYPGGSKALESFFEKNIEYPADAADNGVEGTVNISFTVDEKGKVSAAKTTNAPLGHGLEQEALRVFNKMPAWKPGSLKGKNVKTRFNLPVRFQLEG